MSFSRLEIVINFIKMITWLNHQHLLYWKVLIINWNIGYLWSEVWDVMLFLLVIFKLVKFEPFISLQRNHTFLCTSSPDIHRSERSKKPSRSHFFLVWFKLNKCWMCLLITCMLWCHTYFHNIFIFIFWDQ